MESVKVSGVRSGRYTFELWTFDIGEGGDVRPLNAGGGYAKRVGRKFLGVVRRFLKVGSEMRERLRLGEAGVDVEIGA